MDLRRQASTPDDDKTFTLMLKEPYGLVLESRSASRRSNVPFMMPKRVADTPGDRADLRFHRLRPVRLQARRVEARRQDGLRQVRRVQAARRARRSGLAGGKVVKVDRVEWLAIPDHADRRQCAVGGRDRLHRGAAARSAAGAEGRQVDPDQSTEPARLPVRVPLQLRCTRRSTIRRSARPSMSPSNQEPFLKAVIGDPEYYKVCNDDVRLRHAAGVRRKVRKACSTATAAKAKALLTEAGYDGTPVAADALDRPAGADQPARRSRRDLLRKAGFNVDMQSMDWQTVVARRAKKEPPSQGGWNIFLTSWVSADILNPIGTGFLNASCDKAMFGWPCDDAAREAARPVLARDRPGEAEAARRAGTGARLPVRHAHQSRPVVPAGGRARRASMTG